MPAFTAPIFKSGSSNIIPWAGGVPYMNEANQLNKFMGNQALQQFNANLPGYANAVGQRMENTQQMLEGDLPQDVVNQIAQQSAERGVGGGGVSPNSNAAYLRALGLNSLDMQQQGAKQLSDNIADTPTAELWNPASLWVPTVLGQQEASAARSMLPQPTPQANLSTGLNPPGGFGAGMGYNWNSQFGRPSYSFL